MQQPCIRINQSDPPPKFDFLKQQNFLGEFKTEVDKARVRFNLGIPDSYSFNWGNIGGTIDNQRDLKTKFDQYYNLLGIERNRIDDILEQIDVLNSITTRLSNVIEGSDSISQMSTDIEDFKQRLTRAETNINQNTALILQLMNGTITPGGGGGGGSYDLSGYATENWVINYISSTLSGYVSTYAFNELVNRVNSLTGRTLTRIELSQSSLSATVGDNPKSITVTAYYSDNTTSDITETVETVNSSNDGFARWTNHKVQIVGAGTATLTFTYGGFSATLTVTVTDGSVPQVTTKQYVGCAANYAQILGNSEFAYDTIAGAWNSTNLKIFNNLSRFHLFIITTENIDRITAAVGENDLDQIYDSSESYNETNYKIYVIRNLRNTDFEINITLK